MVTYDNQGHLYQWGNQDGQPMHYTLDELYPLKMYTFGEISVLGTKQFPSTSRRRI